MPVLKPLDAHQHAIAAGLTDTPIEEVLTSRAIWRALGYGIPAYQGPGLKEKLRNLGESLKRYSGTVAGEIAKRRLMICGACELYHLETSTCAHPDCGCFVEEKVKIASESCPLGKWKEEEPSA